MTDRQDRDMRRESPMLIDEPDPAPSHDRPRIDSGGRFAGPVRGAPPDPRVVIEELRSRLREEQEKSLNAVDAVLGARAVAAQAKAETQEIFYRLHVRETELEQLKELLAAQAPGSDGWEAVGPVDPATSSSDQDRPSPKAALRLLVASVRAAISDR